MMTEVRMVDTWVGRGGWAKEAQEGGLLGAGQVVLLDLGAGDMGVFSL